MKELKALTVQLVHRPSIFFLKTAERAYEKKKKKNYGRFIDRKRSFSRSRIVVRGQAITVDLFHIYFFTEDPKT